MDTQLSKKLGMLYDLYNLLNKYNVVISWSYADCSDMYGMSGCGIEIGPEYSKDGEAIVFNDTCFDKTDVKAMIYKLTSK